MSCAGMYTKYIQAVKKQLVKRIYNVNTHSEVKVSELQPAQKPNIVFTADKNTISACSHIGDITSKQSFSCPGLFSVDIPSRVWVDRQAEVFLTAPISLSASRLCCQLTPAQGRVTKPVVCAVTGIGEGQFSVMIQSSTAGLHQLRVLVDGVDIYGSPFSVYVTDWKSHGPGDAPVAGVDTMSVSKEKEQQPQLQLTTKDGARECLNVSVYILCSLYTLIVIHAYDVSLRAGKEKEQQLQLQLATVQQKSQEQQQQLSRLVDDMYDMEKKMLILECKYEQQQEELKRAQEGNIRSCTCNMNITLCSYMHCCDRYIL